VWPADAGVFTQLGPNVSITSSADEVLGIAAQNNLESC
jgi:hypothetical protein